jgi:tRNA A37 threonylcarbamoyladenosine biosynthesis protein TsaE
METSFTVSTLEDLRKVALYLKNYYWHNKIFYLKGPIGVGKTQLVQYLLPEYNVTSPTFSLLNIYGENYWHFDI